MLLSLVAVVVGIGLLATAADEFVVGSARLAAVLRLPPVVIGAVVIGFGTSAPELLVSGLAAAQGDLDVGVGNVVGSNVANLTLILGAAAVIAPVVVRSTILRRESPLALASVLVFAVLVQGGFSSVEGVVLLVLLAAALAAVLAGSRGGDDTELLSEVVEEFELAAHRLAPEVLRTTAGLVGTVGGAWALVWGAERIADEVGLSGGFVGVSLVAVGTSLPELVTAIAAVRHGEQELIVGNLLGSNLFNSLAVGGAIALLGSGAVPDDALSGIGAVLMSAVAVVAFVFLRTGSRVERWEGAVLLAGFAGFLVVSYLTQPDDVLAALGA